jgi:hypothetical protein
MSTLVAIDPGYAKDGKGCAVAIFDRHVLTQVFFARPETVDVASLYVGAGEIVWEQPQVDARTRVTVPAVVQLASTGGVLAGMFAGANRCRVVVAKPSAWKGSTSKPVAHGRMWEKLATAEVKLLGGAATLQRIDAAKHAGAIARWKPGEHYYGSWTGHNLLDAVGIGMWRLGR